MHIFLEVPLNKYFGIAALTNNFGNSYFGIANVEFFLEMPLWNYLGILLWITYNIFGSVIMKIILGMFCDNYWQGGLLNVVFEVLIWRSFRNYFVRFISDMLLKSFGSAIVQLMMQYCCDVHFRSAFVGVILGILLWHSFNNPSVKVILVILEMLLWILF